MDLEARKAPSQGVMLAGKYRVERVLGSGGMGVVVSALHVHLQDEVAIKLLRADRIVPGRSAERLIREARAACKIRSEHVARVFDVGILDDGSPYIVMERLRGRDLASRLASDGPLSVESAIDVVLQACEALVEAHALGIVHRDLKPANLFQTHRMDGSLCVKVLDFGVSKILTLRDGARSTSSLRSSKSGRSPKSSRSSKLVEHGASRGNAGEDSLLPVTADATWETRDAFEKTCRAPSPADAACVESERMPPSVGGALTGTGARLGSPSYMAPEQIMSARHVDARADIWSLGTIVYELLAGCAAFMGESLDEVTKSILEDNPVAIRRIRSDVPPALERVIARCLEKSPSNRPPNVATLAHALAPFASRQGRRSLERIVGVMRPEHSPGRAPSFFTSPLSWSRRSQVIAFAATSLVALTVLLIAGRRAPVPSIPLDEKAHLGASVFAAAPHASAVVASPDARDVPDARDAPEPRASAASLAIPTPATSTPPRRAPRPARSAAAPAGAAGKSAPSPSSSSELDPGHLFDGPQ